MSRADNGSSPDLRRLAAAALLLAGLLWLLAAVGFIPERFVRAASSLWPLAAIGLGLDLVAARRLPFGIPYSVVTVVVIGVAGLFFPGRTVEVSGGATPTDMVQSFVEPIGNANRADVSIRTSTTSLALLGGVEQGTLLQATGLGQATLAASAEGRSVRRLELEASTPSRRGNRTDTGAAAVEVRLTDRVPLELDVAGGLRSVTVDLTGLDIAQFGFRGAGGPARILLAGAGPARYDARIVGGAGPIDLTVPEGARLNARLEPGPGGASVSIGERADMTLVLRAGEGPVVIDVPDAARVRVVVDDAGGGMLALADRIEPVNGRAQGEAQDVYETPGYRDVIPAIEIRIEETGAGPIQIR